MTKKEKDKELPPGEAPPEEPPAEPPNPPPSDNNPPADGHPKGYVTEESYQGLQRVVAKKDKELEDLKERTTTLATQLEELKTNSQTLTGTKSDLEKQLQEAQGKLEELETSRNKLDTQLRQQGIIMQEFPALASLAEYIPPSDDDEEFRKNAKQFSEAMGAFVKTGVKDVLQGSIPPQPPPDDGTSESEEDMLWDRVYALAGIQGKEDEYDEANAKLQKILAAKNKS